MKGDAAAINAVARRLEDHDWDVRRAVLPALAKLAKKGDAAAVEAVANWVERFDRRVIEPFELFRSELGQNPFKNQEFSLENLKISENHFLKRRRNSDQISSKLFNVVSMKTCILDGKPSGDTPPIE